MFNFLTQPQPRQLIPQPTLPIQGQAQTQSKPLPRRLHPQSQQFPHLQYRLQPQQNPHQFPLTNHFLQHM